MNQQYDVVVIGTGVAGLYAALKFEEDVKVLIVSKRKIGLSNSSLAQGGVAAVLDKKHDNYNLHMSDTLIAGGYTNDISSVHVLVTEGPEEVMRLKELGVDFDSNQEGRLSLTLEGGHSRRRIVHHKDSTGKEIVETLTERLPFHYNIDIEENTMMFDIAKAENGFYIGLMSNDGNYIKTVLAKYCILATGGIGRLYQYTTNSEICTGDGITAAYELGARIKNLSLIQFHPTAFHSQSSRECFLISEAVRGEGAKLLNANGEPFMYRYDERGELAPRDVVSLSILKEEKRIGDNHFYLDITHRPAEYIKKRFPMIYARCLEEGIDMSTDRIPVYPCQHYLMGGIDVDLDGKTTIDRLYACGECSHTGVHGSNRLASNSILEAIVFSKRTADDIIKNLQTEKDAQIIGTPPDYKTIGKPLEEGNRTEIRKIIQETYFVVPADKNILEKNLKRITHIKEKLINGNYELSSAYIEAKSLATVAEIILKEAGRNQKSEV